ncbi:MAG TPA: dihydrolipoamide acetyltransferase family protein [Candidatus Dormibacteraeota bacterium]|nr:dihydrolipoamide acetyltransferase family protein [Candidatus Dormibacteraeota bacterium]
MADQTFNLPDLGEGLSEAQLMSWRVQEGARVEVNAPLCDVETAKAVVVIPSPFAGVIRKLHAKPGESVDVGAPLVTIESAEGAGEHTPGTLVGYGPGGGPETGIRRRPRASPASDSPAGEVRAAPFVRQLAKEHSVDLATVTGTGPGGRITRADVEAAAAPAPAGSAQTQGAAVEGERRVSVVGLRKAIARQMVRSVSTIPQFTEFAIFDATALAEARARAKAIGRSVTPLAYFVRAVAASLRAYPMLNSSWDEKTDEIVIKQAVNLGIAVNTEKGLLVPVIRDADRLDLEEIAQKSAHLIEGARAGSLSPADMTGGTVTLTNVGASGPVETGTPIINPPECCVVGFGAIKPRAMVVGGEVVPRPGAWISISVDHRIVDGAMATEFLTDLVGQLEKIDD